MSARAYLAGLYEKARVAVVDDAGHWKTTDLQAELVELLQGVLPPDVALRLVESQARSILTENEDRRHPTRLKSPAGTLYHPDAIIPLNGERVLMAAATRDDLSVWTEIIATNLERQSRAAADNLKYTSTRLAAFGSGSFLRLHDVETDLFGWVAPIDGEVDPADDLIEATQ